MIAPLVKMQFEVHGKRLVEVVFDGKLATLTMPSGQFFVLQVTKLEHVAEWAESFVDRIISEQSNLN